MLFIGFVDTAVANTLSGKKNKKIISGTLTEKPTETTGCFDTAGKNMEKHFKIQVWRKNMPLGCRYFWLLPFLLARLVVVVVDVVVVVFAAVVYDLNENEPLENIQYEYWFVATCCEGGGLSLSQFENLLETFQIANDF